MTTLVQQQWEALHTGLAQLRSGNLLTGQLYIALDFFPDAAPAKMDWRTDYPGGTHIGSVGMTNDYKLLGRVEGVRICGSAVVATVNGDWLRLYAVKQPEVTR